MNKTFLLLFFLLCLGFINAFGQNVRTMRLPYMDDLKRSYPKHDPEITAQTLSREIGGEVLEIYRLSNNPNSCALRVSIALTKAGITIPSTSYTFLGADGKNYFVTASRLIEWMVKTFPKPIELRLTQKMKDTDSANDMIGQKEGIYAMLPDYPGNFGASGHIDIFYKQSDLFDCDGGCYFSQANKAYFWELPKRPTNPQIR